MQQTTRRFEAHDVALRTWRHPGQPPPQRRLLCLPYAGGGSAAFKPLAAALGPDWAVHAVDPPGHGLGAQGALFDRVPDLVEAYLECLPEDAVAGAHLLGFSLGGYVAHALTWALLARRPGRGPLSLTLCAAPPYARRAARYSHLADDALFDGLVRLGGIPRGLSDARTAFSMFAHVVRADFRAWETCPAPPPGLDLPALCVAAEGDPLCPPEWLDDWRPHLPRMRVARVPGGHVFLNESSDALARHLDALAAAC